MTTLISDRVWAKGGARPSTAARFSPSRALAGIWALQRDRWILWLPVGVIAGAAAWITAPADPPTWLGGAVFMGALALSCVFAFLPSRRVDGADVLLRRILAGAFAMLAAAGLGAAAAQVRTWEVSAPPFVSPPGPVEVRGWVADLDAGQSGPRLRILTASIEGLAAPPRYVRVAVPARAVLTPGRAVSCRAVLAPPAGPLAPGGYDFARRAFFERLGASGYSYGRCRPIELSPPPNLLDRLRLRLAAMRYDLSAAIQDISPGRGGAIAAALVAGDRSAVDNATNTALQNSGLGHLLSVSGVHMGVVGGLVFAALVWSLALIPPLALRAPVRKIAAAGALAALAFYVVISGWSVPALRSYIMACVAFGAILIDRPAISMRGLALAALVATLLFPESVLEPGFQMSFAATMALVALYEIARRPRSEPILPAPGPLIGVLQWMGRGMAAALGVSLVAGLATDPFALYHFQRFSLYALAANMAIAPIMSFVVAPAAGVAAVLAPFGLADAPLKAMAAALDLVAAIGDAFGSRPEAVRALPRPPDAALIACVGGLLWACLWRGALRWGALAAIPLVLLCHVGAPRPVIAFDSDLRALFVREDGHWSLLRGASRSNYGAEKLGAMLGVSPVQVAHLAPPEGCTPSFCALRQGDVLLAFDAAGLAHSCRAGAVVLTRIAAPARYKQQCRVTMVDAADLARLGGGMIYETPRGLRLQRASPLAVRRPWTPHARGDDDQA
ncbi:MAG TPA: ComEC/Rec2 family competence protein [Caulobacterales bacterium]|nr:ComEC/Rec2 family competence protein [Caulobacterales bacterium]